jgi:phosphatidylinositol alpha 1,6-mannosyltransferase
MIVMTQLPRIAFFAASMKDGQDGVTRVLYKISEKLQTRAVAHVFFSAVVPPKPEQSVPMHRVPSVQIPFYKEYRYPLLADFKVAAVLGRYKPDILSVHSPCSLGWAAINYAKLHRMPVVAHYHTHFVHYASYYRIGVLTDLGWEYMKLFYGAMCRTFVPSRPIFDELASHHFKNLDLLPHGVDTSVFSPSFKNPEWKKSIGAEGKTVLLYVGRLVWEKDLATLAAAYRLMRRENSDAVLVIVGDGPVRSDLQQLIPDAIFLGYCSGKRLSECYASSDVFLFPSSTETFGMVTLEAMASGLVPVCAHAGGAAGLIRHGKTGMLAKSRDAEDFARACLEVISDKSKKSRMASAAYSYSLDHTWDAIADRMLGKYAEVIENYRLRKKRGIGIEYRK